MNLTSDKKCLFMTVMFFFNKIKKSGASAVVCLNPTNGPATVKHYYNTGFTSALLDSAVPALGISNATVKLTGATLVCSFTRQNSHTNTKYFNLDANRSPYLLTAFGTLSSAGGGRIYMAKI